MKKKEDNVWDFAPGSDKAVAHGCTCPREDNGHGVGMLIGGLRQWWIDMLCPLHGWKGRVTDVERN